MPLVKIEPYSANSSADFTFNNLIVTGNLYSNYSNSAFQAANSAGVYANAAFAAANTGGAGTDTWARDAANSASSYANGAFVAANTGSGGASGSYANSAYLAANSAGSYANSAYASANNANVVNITQNTNITSAASYANSAYLAANSAGSYANSSFATANNANVVNITQNTNITSAASYANGAFQAANSAGSYANSSFATANNANVVNITQNTNITSAASYANGAFAAANAASSGTTGTHANSAYQAANSAGIYANSAFLKANNALANTTGTFGGTLTVAGTLNADGLSITGTGGTISALNLIYSNTIFANSNVGIGVTTTSAKLDLGGTGVEVPQIIWSRGNDDSAFISKLKTGNTGTAAVQSSIGLDYLNDFASIKFYRASTAGEIHWYLGSTATVGTEQMRLNSTGLGIGTSAPSTKLHISSGTPVVTVTSTGTTAASQDFTTNSAAQRTTIGVERAAGGGLFVGSSAYAAVFGSAGAAVTQFATNNNVRVTIDTSGNLGIGTTSPARTFHVQGTIGAYHNANDNQILMYNNGTVGSISVTYGTTGSYLPLTFLTSDAEKMRITAAGNVGIGTSSPGTALHVSAAFQNQLRIQETGGTFFDIAVGARFDLRNAAGTTIVSIAQGGSPVGTQLNITAAGNVGIGVVPSAWGSAYKTLDIGGTGGIYGPSSGLSFADNMYYSGTSWYTKTAGLSSLYVMSNGEYLWYSCPSTTAGATPSIYERMRIDTSGNLGIGITPVGKLSISYTPSTNWGLDFAANGGSSAQYITLAGGATYDLADGSGFVILHSNTTGTAGYYAAYAGLTSIFTGDTSEFVTGLAPSSSQISFGYNSGTGKYRIKNGKSTTVSIYVTAIRTREAS